MRPVVLLLTSLVLPIVGCATGHTAAQTSAKREWDALCRRLPRRSHAERAAVRFSQPRPHQEAALRVSALAAAESVVHVRTIGTRNRSGGDDRDSAREIATPTGGTGIVLLDRGIILTNEHVIRQTRRITVVLHDGSEYPVERVLSHPRYDIALLRIAADGLKPLTPSPRVPAAGTQVVAVAFADDPAEPNYRTGTVTHTHKSLQRELDPMGKKDYGSLLESTAALGPGFSGGPLLDSNGRLIGLNVATAGNPETLQRRGYALPFDKRIDKAVQELVAVMDAVD